MNTEETKIFTSLPAIFHCILSWDAKHRMTKYSGISDIFHDRREWNISQKWTSEWFRIQLYEESFTSLFLPGNDVNIWVSDGFNGVYYLYTSTVRNTELSEGSFDYQQGWFNFGWVVQGNYLDVHPCKLCEAPRLKNVLSYGRYCVLINMYSGRIYIRPLLLKYRCNKKILFRADLIKICMIVCVGII